MKTKSIKYRSIDIAKVLAIPLYGTMTSNIYKAIFHFNSFGEQQRSTEIYIIYSHHRSGRSDYFQITANLAECIEELSPAFIVMQSSMSLLDKFRLLKHFCMGIVDFSELKGSLINRLYHLLLFARVKVNVDYTMAYLEESAPKVVVTFCDAHDFDNVITQCANKLNIKTVTLQHGQYFIDTVDTPENMALSNLSSNYFCAWGQATCDEFKNIDNGLTKAVSLGSLRRETHQKIAYTGNAILESKSENIICVMLNADNCIESNIEMLKTIIEFCEVNCYQYCIRFHPKNNKSNYIEFFKNEYFVEYQNVERSKIAFSTIFTSGVMVELLSQGQLFFIYQNATTPKLFQQGLLAFKGGDQLKLMVENLYEDSTQSAKELNYLKDYFINASQVKTNYLTFFEELLANKG
jgi:hypothetical protein